MECGSKDLFSTPVFTSKVQNIYLIERAAYLALEFHKNSKNPLLVSEKWNDQVRSQDKQEKDKFGTTSFGDNQKLFESKEWVPIAEAILDCVNEMLFSAYGEFSHTPILQTMWLSVYPDGGFVPEHVHANSIFSGVFYANAKPNAGNLIFSDPAWITKTMFQVNNMNKSFFKTKHEMPVETGKVILFPGWLPHSSQPNNSGENRIIIGFNVGFGTNIKQVSDNIRSAQPKDLRI